jgi:hypothetical protein
VSLIDYALRFLFGWHAVLGGGEPSVHWTASYVDAAGTHVIEVWRQPGHVRRVTDRTLELDAVRPAGDGYQFSINDRERGVTFHGTERDRIMQRSFDDWQRWTHVVAPPSASALALPLLRLGQTTPAGRCRWFVTGDTELCWSHRFALPLVIRTRGKAVYVVSSVEPFGGAIPPFVPVGAEVGRDDD